MKPAPGEPAEAYREKMKTLGNPANRNPAYVLRVVRSHCDEAARRFCDDLERESTGMRNFLIRASHHWHGEVQELVQINASRARIKEVFEESKAYNGIQIDVCEEILRFKLAMPQEREGLNALRQFAVDEGLTSNYAIDQAVALLYRCSQGYDA